MRYCILYSTLQLDDKYFNQQHMTIEFVGNSVNSFVIIIQKILDVTNANNCCIVLEIDNI
jgi:hypothetical protein